MIEWNEKGIIYENTEGIDVVNMIVQAASKFVIQYNPKLEDEIRDICISSPKSMSEILKSKKRHYLWEYIMSTTPLLTFIEEKFNIHYNTSMRVNWCLSHRQMFPQCLNEKCTTKLLYHITTLGWNGEYDRFCHNKTKCVNQSSYHRSHVKQTLMKHYNVDVPAKSLVVQKTMQQTCQERFGVKNPFSRKDIIEKLHSPEKQKQRIETLKKHNQEKYGVDWYFQSEVFLKKTGASDGCSKEEKEIVNFVKENYLSSNILIGSFKIISPYQLDIYIQDLNLAFEFNGTYYHSIEWHGDKEYHLRKTRLCEEKGIKLVHIWEDEWILQKEQTKKAILQYLLGNETNQIDFSNDVLKVDRSKFNKVYQFDGYQLIEEVEPQLILREKRNMEKYYVPDCGNLIYQKI